MKPSDEAQEFQKMGGQDVGFPPETTVIKKELES